jgi:hypothetical protein
MGTVPEGLVIGALGVLHCGSGTARVVRVVGYKVTAVKVRRQDERHTHYEPHHGFRFGLNL